VGNVDETKILCSVDFPACSGYARPKVAPGCGPDTLAARTDLFPESEDPIDIASSFLEGGHVSILENGGGPRIIGCERQSSISVEEIQHLSQVGYAAAQIITGTKAVFDADGASSSWHQLHQALRSAVGDGQMVETGFGSHDSFDKRGIDAAGGRYLPDQCLQFCRGQERGGTEGRCPQTTCGPQGVCRGGCILFPIKTGLVGMELPAKRFAIRDPHTGCAMDLGSGNIRASCEKKEDGGEGNQNAPAGCGGRGVHLEQVSKRGPYGTVSILGLSDLKISRAFKRHGWCRASGVRRGSSLRDSLLGLDGEGSTKADIRYLVEVGVPRSRALYFSRNLKSAMRCGDAQRKFEI